MVNEGLPRPGISAVASLAPCLHGSAVRKRADQEKSAKRHDDGNEKGFCQQPKPENNANRRRQSLVSFVSGLPANPTKDLINILAN
jgi:hypothetical protein